MIEGKSRKRDGKSMTGCNLSKIGLLSGNQIKIIAAISMLIDHFGAIFFPQVMLYRILGRLAFPIFAFMIAEGCRYTKNKVRYFFTVFGCGAAFQAVYLFAYPGVLYLNIFITFSISILLVYALQYAKRTVFSASASGVKKAFSALLFVALVIGAYLLNRVVDYDYGCLGSYFPVAASLFCFDGVEGCPAWLKRLDHRRIHVLTWSLAVVLYSLRAGGILLFAMCAIPVMLLYSGKRGKRNMKYFFYVFYPAHLVVLQGIYLLIAYFSA